MLSKNVLENNSIISIHNIKYNIRCDILSPALLTTFSDLGSVKESIPKLKYYIKSLLTQNNVVKDGVPCKNPLLLVAYEKLLKQLNLADSLILLLENDVNNTIPKIKIAVMGFLKQLLKIQDEIVECYIDENGAQLPAKKIQQQKQRLQAKLSQNVNKFQTELCQLATSSIDYAFNQPKNKKQVLLEVVLLAAQKGRKRVAAAENLDIDATGYLSEQLEAGVELPVEQTRLLQSLNTTIQKNVRIKLFNEEGSTLAGKLIKITDNQWQFVSEPIYATKTTSVYPVKYKITLIEGKAILSTCDEVIKSMQASDRLVETYQAAKKEASFQRRHGTRVEEVKYDVKTNTVFISMDNCGQTLTSVINDTETYSFDKAIEIAQALTEKMSALEKQAIIHCNLNPDNISIKETEGKHLHVSVVNFGAAKKAPSKKEEVGAGVGTLMYLAPDKYLTPEFDRWSFGPVLGQIFYAPKESIFSKRQNLVDASLERTRELVKMQNYTYDSLYHNLAIPADVDNQLTNNIKQLVQEHQKYQAKMRPSFVFSAMFFALIPQRRMAYQHFQQQIQQIAEKIHQLTVFFNKMRIAPLNKDVLRDQINQLKKQGKNPYKLQLLLTYEQMLDSQEKLVALQKPENYKSHYRIAEELLKKGISKESYPNPFPNLNKIQSVVDQFQKIMESTNEKIVGHFANDKFVGSNSSGLASIFTIMVSPQSLQEKVAQLKKLGKEKSEKSISNFYSCLHFFGKGRHENMKVLYAKLADLNEIEPAEQLNEIEQFIETKSFSHN